ncbi:hypothetical protein C9J01_18820 [Photobacterium rosenbergii]|uniref:Uncharacterized protein n=1 Tax=Photobacterium rosenbergii TaxID=294936 RepID=A0A2T3N9Q7_9GAMM|nr:hypothetical protein [Photobacterium rosenbergii]PSW10266.1 hypothetical protein C9J01_18820 [Photobacterium rosenbergii]
MNMLFSVLLALLLVISSGLHAETDNEGSNKYADLTEAANTLGLSLVSYNRELNKEDRSEKELNKQAASLVESLNQFLALSDKAYKEGVPYDVFPGFWQMVDDWQTLAKSFARGPDYLAKIQVTPMYYPNDSETVFSFEILSTGEVIEIPVKDSQINKCGPLRNEDCREVLSDITDAVEGAYKPIADVYLGPVVLHYTSLEAEWKQFYREARYQTPLDSWFSANVVQVDYFKGLDLTGPPKIQVFFLRPTLVFEHLYDAEKGDKDDVSIALEVIGFNRWKEGFGASITTVYNDRKDADAIGIGASIHIKNKFTIGYAYRDDDKSSVFVNLDLLEWFGDNKETYSRYLGYLN